MWSVCHRWRCSSSLSEPVLFHLTVNGRKANCIMRKDDVWKEMKDSDIAVLWFLISIPEWEQRKKFFAFYDHNSFYQVSLGTIIPPEPWDLLSFLIYSMHMLKYRETQRAPVVSTAPWNEATRVFTKISTTERRMELVLPHVREPAPAEIDLWVCL